MKVYFKESTHQYINENNDHYISVSALVKMLEAKKNWSEIKKKYAKKNGLTIEEVTRKWKRASDLGSSAGTLYHQQREQELLSDPQPEYNSVKCSKKSCDFHDGNKVSIPIEKLDNDTIYTELIIYDHEYRICGQSDKVIITHNTINVIDYKTDKSIERNAYSDTWVKPEKLLPPVSHLENCNFNTYSLKMSIYMYMLWKQNKQFKVGDLILEHVKLMRDEEGIPILKDGKPQVANSELVHVPFRRKEVKDIFELYKKGKL